MAVQLLIISQGGWGLGYPASKSNQPEYRHVKDRTAPASGQGV